MAVWSVLVGGSLTWGMHRESQATLRTATAAAHANISKDMSFRKWGNSHGGVYVPPDKHTPPNPYLKVPDRDVVTTTGKALTLMNPAYMLRQIQSDFPSVYGIKSRLTSLKPLNPINAPDAWEAKVLRSFEQGAKDFLEIQQIDGQPYLRMMQPFIVERGCLKCHALQGYKLGDIRGGIGTDVLMAPYWATEREHNADLVLTYGAIWLLGLAGMGVSYRRISRLDAEREKAVNALRELNEELETRVAERTAQLEDANKELEGFAYTVSHDLRTPLRAIDGFSHILLADYADKLDDEGRRLLNVVRDNTRQMGQLIDDILKFSRIGRVDIAYVDTDMTSLTQAVAEELRPAEGKQQINIAALPAIRGDRAMLRQVWVNLLSNAIKFSRVNDPALIEVGGSIDGDEAIYYVKDNGAGFDMQYADKLFGVFQRLHSPSEFEGTGIGLAIVKRIITRHGGRVWAEGRVGEGATFYFALPT
ncbi:MAG: DUF3365 domain-containing protein [Gallionella sp.]|nr:DUF3365 domain-containing protein [Gallionella sp.]